MSAVVFFSVLFHLPLDQRPNTVCCGYFCVYTYIVGRRPNPKSPTCVSSDFSHKQTFPYRKKKLHHMHQQPTHTHTYTWTDNISFCSTRNLIIFWIIASRPLDGLLCKHNAKQSKRSSFRIFMYTYRDIIEMLYQKVNMLAGCNIGKHIEGNEWAAMHWKLIKSIHKS